MSQPEPKILLVTRNFPPRWGGMERLNCHIADELSQRADVQVIAPDGAAASGLPDRVHVHEIPLSPLPRCLLSAGIRALRVATAWRPDVVLAGSGLTAPIAWLTARLCGARAYVYVHGLDLTVPHPVYQRIWMPLLRRLDGIIANSRATAELARQAGIAAERIHIVHPGVTLPTTDSHARVRFRAAHQLGDAPVLLSVGRLTQRKGLHEFVADVLPMIAAAKPDVRLVIVGDAPTHALYAEIQTPASIQAAADAAGVGGNLLFLGTQFGQQLADAYAGSDLHVFPVRHLANDPEGFGMVAIEAAAHGLATVAYATGGVVDAVEEGVSGRLVDPGNGRRLAEVVLSVLKHPIQPETLRAFAARFEWACFGQQLAAVLWSGYGE